MRAGDAITLGGMDRVALRPAGANDAERIAKLINAAFRAARTFTDDDRTNPEQIRGLLQKGSFLLAEDEGKLAGCVYVELRGERGYFGLLAVEPEKQRAGMGSRLVTAAENYCRSAGCRFLDMTFASLRKDLPSFYQWRGYRESGTEPFPQGMRLKEPCHLIRMTKALAEKED